MPQILTSPEIRAWDEYTIANEPVASIDLMERAALACAEWLFQSGYDLKKFSIFCGKGNNGGDGLALARILSQGNNEVTVYILEFGHKGTNDFQVNLERLHESGIELKFIPNNETIPVLNPGEIVIDALLGSGLNRPVDGLTAGLVNYINKSGNEIIAIDIPSGLSADAYSYGNIAINASHTLSFQCFKKAFLVAENAIHTGTVHILDIGLHPDFLLTNDSKQYILEAHLLRAIYRPRSPFSHKGSFGHALLVAGSYGKMGAAVLSAKGCLHAGIGLITVHVPGCGYSIMQSSVPEAMVITDIDEKLNTGIKDDLSKYQVIGIGPGIGTDTKTGHLVFSLLKEFNKPIVLDADALNLIAENKDWLGRIPEGSILTPHPKEFERLFGKSNNDFDRIALAQEKAMEFNTVIVLKGRYTCIALPSGKTYFNTTGNPGMATGGTGDVLTGILTALIGQGYTSYHAALMGVYLHGRAGDIAAAESSQESLSASDLVNRLGLAFRELH